MYRYIFAETLERMGHEVVFYPCDEALKSFPSAKKADLMRISDRIFSEFLDHHRKKPFDLFLSYYHAAQVTPELFRQVRDHTLCVNYTTNFHQIGMYAPLLQDPHLTIYVSKAAEPYFANLGIKAYYMPFAGLRDHLGWNDQKNGQITFVGTSYGPRAYYIWRCLQQGMPMRIHGANWLKNHRTRASLRVLRLEKQILSGSPLMTDTAYRTMNDLILYEINKQYRNSIHAPLNDEEYTRLLSVSSIVLNFPESRFGHDFSNPEVLIGANLRDFEVPTAGSFLLTQDSDEIRTYFEPGREIEVFHNEWEMAGKARFYLEHPEIALKIARAGHERVIREHLWEHRFEKLIAYLEQNHL
jgi:hypothetical protein